MTRARTQQELDQAVEASDEARRPSWSLTATDDLAEAIAAVKDLWVGRSSDLLPMEIDALEHLITAARAEGASAERARLLAPGRSVHVHADVPVAIQHPSHVGRL